MRRRMVFRSNFEENSSVGGVVYAREYFTRDRSCKGTCLVWIRGYVKISILKFIEVAKVKGGKFRFGSRKNEGGRKERK